MTIEAVARWLSDPRAAFVHVAAAAFDAGITVEELAKAIELALAKKEAEA